ncbi:Nucleotide-binding universal stress protein, UspA family [Tistlia consotensis]|uniref:Nucleotide-binding universal stress protein, UspA family n=1 Tax=Tistlia consotensis USBA 355 TaxID=560819 RepID=A0A1Y6CM27_9PROT|nr:universal stress protein [Tistlia consotensis]SMF63913.1 Nucleotide-binding universal stress protein, UspA family [Tistlia consotensis USBA 355]SNR98244.1 Nucleotide-binding universal stress protein, UspA family [Tistlia consotensis]
MKSILIATDLSARSDRALDRALLLAREQQAALTVLHVVEDRGPDAAVERQEAEAGRAIGAYLAARGGGLEVAVEVKVGEADREILRLAQRRGADLVVLGAHRVAADDSFTGSTAWKVLRDSALPVLLVQEAALAPYRKVAVGFDFSGFSEAALRLALRFDPEELIVIHAFHVPYGGFLKGSETRSDVRGQHEEDLARAVEAALAALPSEEAAAAAKVRIERRLSRGEIVTGLWDHCAHGRSDLLAIGTHGRSGLAHAVFGSVAESLLREPPCDIVAVRARTAKTD